MELKIWLVQINIIYSSSSCSGSSAVFSPSVGWLSPSSCGCSVSCSVSGAAAGVSCKGLMHNLNANIYIYIYIYITNYISYWCITSLTMTWTMISKKQCQNVCQLWGPTSTIIQQTVNKTSGHGSFMRVISK